MIKKPGELEGISFGLTSGVITILGVLIGLAATGNKSFTIVGIIIVGIADALSDAVGMYVSQESEYIHTSKQILSSAFSTFLGKIGMAFLLLVPLLFLNLYTAVVIAMTMGILIIAGLGYLVAKGSSNKMNCFNIILKYIVIVIVVSLVSYLIGNMAGMYLT